MNNKKLPSIFINIAKIKIVKSELYQALDFYTKAKSILINNFGEKHLKTGEIYKAIAINYENLRVYSSAIDSYEIYMKIKYDLQGENYPDFKEDKKKLSILKKLKKKNRKICAFQCNMI